MSERRTIFSDFEQWQPQRDDTLAEAITTGLVVLDTNVLLSFYRQNPKATRQWIAALQKLGDRIWVPHHVLYEFWKNRDSNAAHPSGANASLKDIQKGQNQIRDAYRHWLNRSGEEEPDAAINELFDSLNKATEKPRKAMELAVQEHSRRFSADPTKDEVVQNIAPLLEGKVGPGFTSEQLAEEKKIADRRYKEKIPPGFEDDSEGHGQTGKSSDSKYGDYFVWRQILNHLLELGQARRRHLVLVTGDTKRDWWQTLATPAGEQAAHIPHPELRAEVSRLTAGSNGPEVTYTQLRPPEFLDAARKYLGAEVSDSTISTNESLSDPNDWYPYEFFIGAYLNGKHGQRARATIRRDGRTLVLAGSLAKMGPESSMPGGYGLLRAKLVEESKLEDDEEEANHYRFTEDVQFNSPSAAACVVNCANVSGLTKWVTDDKLTLQEIQAEADFIQTDEDEEG